MAKFAALMIWTDAWIADTAHLTRCERGTYFDLLVLMWRSPGCCVPNDDVWLARHMRMTATEVASELRPIIAEFCQTDGNHIWQKRLTHEFSWATKKRASATVRAKSRWDNKKDVCQSNATVTVTVPVTVPIEKNRESLVVEGVQGEAKTSRAVARKTTIPSDWYPQAFGDEDRGMFAEMSDWAKAKNATYADWEAFARNWKRRRANFFNNGGSNGRRAGSLLDEQDRIVNELKARGVKDGYIPGTSGPRPLVVATGPSPNGLRLIPKG